MTESDDDEPQLSAVALAALNEFYAERQEKEDQLKQLSDQKYNNCQTIDIKFDEDWQLSQFWYDDQTVDTIVNVALKVTENDGSIALISCPTLYPSLNKTENKRVKLFEFDKRFSIYGSNYIPYDYNNPLDVPESMSKSFDLVIADPPFLSEECLGKTSQTIHLLAKRHILICTGAIMADLVGKLLDVKMCDFEPRHKNNLANDFRCYSNFKFDSLIQK